MHVNYLYSREPLVSFYQQLHNARRVQESTEEKTVGWQVITARLSDILSNACCCSFKQHLFYYIVLVLKVCFDVFILRLSTHISVLALLNLVLCPFIFFYQIIYFFFRYAEVRILSFKTVSLINCNIKFDQNIFRLWRFFVNPFILHQCRKNRIQNVLPVAMKYLLFFFVDVVCEALTKFSRIKTMVNNTLPSYFFLTI